MLTINSTTSYCELNEGIALFNNFTGNTHFLPPSLSKSIITLAEKPYSKEELLDGYLCDNQGDTTVTDEAKKQFQQFITEALKSGIIVETN